MANSNSILRWRFIGFWVFTLLTIARFGNICNWARSDQEIRERFYGNNILNATLPRDEGSIAKMIDHVVEKEFSEMNSLKTWLSHLEIALAL